MNPSHIFFDLHGTLVDGVRLHPCYTEHLSRIMSREFGGTREVWREANLRVLADWDAYYADLDLTGDRGLADMWEGMLRTTRAMFRLACIPLPPPARLRAFSRQLPGLVTRHCDALYPEARAVIQRLCAAGYMLGVTSHATSEQARGLLRGGDVLRYFAAPVLGPDVTERFEKDAVFYNTAARLAGVSPLQCLAIDDSPRCVEGARAAGMRAVLLVRNGDPTLHPRDQVIGGSLTPLLDHLGLDSTLTL